MPLIVTLEAPACHSILMQGDGFGPGIVKAQPETVWTSLSRSTDPPEALVFEFAVVSVAAPPCGH